MDNLIRTDCTFAQRILDIIDSFIYHFNNTFGRVKGDAKIRADLDQAQRKYRLALASAKGMVRGSIKNADTGWNIQVSGQVFNETTKYKNKQAIEAVPYLEYINSIVENTILLDSFAIPKEKVKSDNSVMMHSLYAVADIGNGKEVLKLYVEEINDVNREGTIKRSYKLLLPAASARVRRDFPEYFFKLFTFFENTWYF